MNDSVTFPDINPCTGNEMSVTINFAIRVHGERHPRNVTLSVYAETGPIFVHTQPCTGPERDDRLPRQLDEAPMTLRPYSHDNRIAYHHATHVPERESLTDLVSSLLDLDDVAFVSGRNVRGGCCSFGARRVGNERPRVDMT